MNHTARNGNLRGGPRRISTESPIHASVVRMTFVKSCCHNPQIDVLTLRLAPDQNSNVIEDFARRRFDVIFMGLLALEGIVMRSPCQWISHLAHIAATLVLAALVLPVHAQGVSIDFANSRGSGIAADTVLIENIRVQVAIPNPFVPGTTTTQTATYNVNFRFDPNSLHLIPVGLADTTTAGCASADVQVYNAVTGSANPLAGASVLINGRTVTTGADGVARFTGLPGGSVPVSIQVSATGYTSATQAAVLSCTSANTVAVALSPAQGQTDGLRADQFRVILTWGQNPTDLDSHMTGPNTDGTRWHVYYSTRTAGSICGLDVDDTTSYGPETITCPATRSSAVLRPGVYRYSVHHYSGIGTIGTSSATVRLELGNGQTYSFTPPPGNYTGSNNVWTVFEITVNTNGTLSVAPVNSISNASASTVQSSPMVQFGSPESTNVFDNLPAKR